VTHKLNNFLIQNLKLIFMKKFLFLTIVFGAIMSVGANAQVTTTTTAPAPQASSDQAAAMLAQAKKIVPQMVEKTGLTEAQANKVIEINFETRMAAAGLRDLSDADRTAKITELKAAKAKKLSELLTPEQIASVNKFYEDMGKANQPQKANN
jgi:hypothetical protein